jgi:ATP-dependent RNA helicase RhlE
MRFSEFNLDPALLRGIADQGFAEATPIQQDALPHGLAGHDLMAAAMTGSGKTAAFALPILQRLHGSPARGFRALVLTPTRELAAQVHTHLAALGRHTRITSTAVFGGVGPTPQIKAFRGGVDVVVATPGRLLDHMGTGVARLDNVEVLVLDEADRMLDMGFLPAVRQILSRLPKRRQTMLFSATLPSQVLELSRTFMVNPIRIGVERRAAPATGVTQAILPVPEKLKRNLLVEVLRRDSIRMALVFTRTKHRANRLAQFLTQTGITCDRIHGNRSQSQRESALAAFKSGRLQVLVATDIASRGIDVQDLPHVINFDVPIQPDDYIHRVGRTARAERTGQAVTLASPEEEAALAAIERAVGARIARRRLDGFDYQAQVSGRLEIPVAERIAAMRAQRAASRTRANSAPRPHAAAGAHSSAVRHEQAKPRTGQRAFTGRPRRRGGSTS